jgi:transcriptional regulator with PAS, ATPase and Fis domain
MDELRSYHWPGNVRELEHTIERAVALAPDGRPIGPGLVNWRRPRHALSALADAECDHKRGLADVVAEVEKKVIADAMERFAGNRSAVAAKLKIPRSTLRHKLKKFGLM